jgi:hypothetical protein
MDQAFATAALVLGLPSDDDERAQEVVRTVIEFATAGELDLVTLTDRVVQCELQRAQPGVPGPQQHSSGLAFVFLRATRTGPVCLIEFPEQLCELVWERTLWRKLIFQRLTQLGTNKQVIITLLPVARFSSCVMPSRCPRASTGL